MLKAILASLILMTNAYAGDRAGNGGDVLVCNTRQRPAIQFFDIYEAQSKGFELELNEVSIYSNLKKAIARLAVIDKVNAEEIEKGIEAFANDIMMYERGESRYLQVTTFSNDMLIDIQDTIETTIPRECEIQQLVIHNKSPFWRGKPFTIAKKLWDKLSVKDKSMAVIHEALYIHFSSKGWNDSRFVRHLNSVLNSSAFSIYGLDNYLEDVNINLPSSSHFKVLVPNPFPNKSDLLIQKVSGNYDYVACSLWGDNLVSYFAPMVRCSKIDPLASAPIRRENVAPFAFKNEVIIIHSVVTHFQTIIGYQGIVVDGSMTLVDPYFTSPSSRLAWINSQLKLLESNNPKVIKVFISPSGEMRHPTWRAD